MRGPSRRARIRREGVVVEEGVSLLPPFLGPSGVAIDGARIGVRCYFRVPRRPSPAAAFAAPAAGRLCGSSGGLLPPGPLELLLPAPVALLEGLRVGLAEAHRSAQARRVDAGRGGRVGGRAQPEPADLCLFE